MTGPVTALRTLAAAAVVLTAAVLAGSGAAGLGATHGARSVDTKLCGFPLEVTVRSKGPVDRAAPTVFRFRLTGPSTITLRNRATGRTARLDSPGTYAVDTRTGSVGFRGHRVWFWTTGPRVPFASSDGGGSFAAPGFELRPGASRARARDPCALVGPARSTRPRTTSAPWGLPASALGQMREAGLVPLLGRVIRHDHVHLDVVVDGRKVTVPGGLGLAEPRDGGPCPMGPGDSGDCATGKTIFARVANAPLHTHAPSGLVHVEADRPGRYTLGQVFDLWGVRLTDRCLGGHCAERGSELRVYVDGRLVAGDPRAVELLDHRQITVAYGTDFAGLPARYDGRWPGGGCGGPGERSCN